MHRLPVPLSIVAGAAVLLAAPPPAYPEVVHGLSAAADASPRPTAPPSEPAG